MLDLLRSAATANSKQKQTSPGHIPGARKPACAVPEHRAGLEPVHRLAVRAEHETVAQLHTQRGMQLLHDACHRHSRVHTALNAFNHVVVASL